MVEYTHILSEARDVKLATSKLWRNWTGWCSDNVHMLIGNLTSGGE